MPSKRVAKVLRRAANRERRRSQGRSLEQEAADRLAMDGLFRDNFVLYVDDRPVGGGIWPIKSLTLGILNGVTFVTNTET